MNFDGIEKIFEIGNEPGDHYDEATERFGIVMGLNKLREIRKLTETEKALENMYTPNDKSINKVIKNKMLDSFKEKVTEYRKKTKEIYKTISENPEAKESFELREILNDTLIDINHDYTKLKITGLLDTPLDQLNKIKEMYEEAEECYFLSCLSGKHNKKELGNYLEEQEKSENTIKIFKNITEINEESYKLIKETMLQDILRWQTLCKEKEILYTLHYNLSKYLDLAYQSYYIDSLEIESLKKDYQELINDLKYTQNEIEINAYSLVIDYANRSFFKERKRTKLQRQVIKSDSYIKHLYKAYSMISYHKPNPPELTNPKVRNLLENVIEYSGGLGKDDSENQNQRNNRYQKIIKYWP